MSGDDAPLVLVPAGLAKIVAALATVSRAPLPAYALIGGMAVNIRLSTSTAVHRATADIDLVVESELSPTAGVLAAGDAEARMVDGCKVDVIATEPLVPADLDGLDDGQALFVAGHRFALETAAPVRLAVRGAAVVTLPVASAAGLVAAKAHAIGHARARRTQTKGPGDHYDVFRLLQVLDARGDVRRALLTADERLRQLVADVLGTAFLRSPERVAGLMRTPAGHVIDPDEVVDVVGPVVEALERG